MKTTCIVSNAFPFIALLYLNFREMSSNFYVKNIQILPLYFMQFFRFLAIFCRIIKTTADNKFCHPLSFFMMQNLLITAATPARSERESQLQLLPGLPPAATAPAFVTPDTAFAVRPERLPDTLHTLPAHNPPAARLKIPLSLPLPVYSESTATTHTAQSRLRLKCSSTPQKLPDILSYVFPPVRFSV